MKLQLYKRAILKEDIKKFKLKKGDVVTLVEYYAPSKSHPAGYTVELFNLLGETIDTYEIEESKLLQVDERMISNVRFLKKAS